MLTGEARSDIPYLSIVVPMFNEGENVAPLVAEIEEVIPSIGRPVEVILVDDGSVDGTWEAIAAAAKGRSWLRGIRFLSNRGQTAGMAAGISASRGELIAFLDGDLQNDPHDLPKLLEPIEQGTADVVCGWRAERKDPKLSRTVPSILANYLIRHSLHFSVHDVGCTLKVFRRRFIEDVALYGAMHRFLPAYARSQGARIAEVKVSHRPRLHGESKYGLDRIGKVLVDLLTVKMLNEYGASPAYLFGKIALLFFLLGTAAFVVVAWRVLVLGRVESTPLIFIMTIMYITAVLSLMSGLLAEINVRVLHQVGGQRPYKVIERLGFEEPGGE